MENRTPYPDGIKQEVKTEDENKAEPAKLESNELTIKDEIKTEPIDELDIGNGIKLEPMDALDIKNEITMEPNSSNEKISIEHMTKRFKQRRKRTPYNRHQLLELEKEFKTQQFINYKERCKIATNLELTELQVKVWFQNRRAKDKRIEAGLTSPWSTTRWISKSGVTGSTTSRISVVNATTSTTPTPTTAVPDGETKSDDPDVSIVDVDGPVKIIQCENGKFRHKRTNFSTEQLEILEREFNDKKYLSFLERCQLASVLKLTETQVQVWFQNRRSRWKKLKPDPDNPDGIRESIDTMMMISKIKDEPVWSESEPMDTSGLQSIDNTSSMLADVKVEPSEAVAQPAMEKSALEMISDAIRALSGADEDLHRGGHDMGYNNTIPSLAAVKEEPNSPEDRTTEYPSLELIGGIPTLPSPDIIDLSISGKMATHTLATSHHIEPNGNFKTSQAIAIKDEPVWTDNGIMKEANPGEPSDDVLAEQNVQRTAELIDASRIIALNGDLNASQAIAIKDEPMWTENGVTEELEPIDPSEDVISDRDTEKKSVEQPSAEPMDLSVLESLIAIKEEFTANHSPDASLASELQLNTDPVTMAEELKDVTKESSIDVKEEIPFNSNPDASATAESQSDTDTSTVTGEIGDSKKESLTDIKEEPTTKDDGLETSQTIQPQHVGDSTVNVTEEQENSAEKAACESSTSSASSESTINDDPDKTEQESNVLKTEPIDGSIVAAAPINEQTAEVKCTESNGI